MDTTLGGRLRQHLRNQEQPIESFEEHLSRNVRQAPVMLGLLATFLFLRAVGARAGAVLLIGASAILLPVSVVRPEVGIHALVINFVNQFDSYYDLPAYFPLPVSLPILYELAISAGILFTLIVPGRLPPLPVPQIALLSVYVALVSLSLVVSEVPWLPDIWLQFRTNFLIRPIFFLFLVIVVRGPEALHRLIVGFTAAHAILMLTSLSDFLQKDLAGYRVAGTVRESNYLSYLCIATLPLLISIAFYFRRMLLRYGMVSLSVLTLFICLRTLSRAGYYSLGAVLAFFAVGLTRSPRMLLSAALFLALFFALVPAELTERLQEVRSVTESDRYFISRIGLRMATDNPILGVGWHAFQERFLDYDTERIYSRPQSPHSLYLAIAAASGFPALAAYLAAYGLTFVQIHRVVRFYVRAGDFRSFGYFLSLGIQGGLIGHFVFGTSGTYGDSYYAYLLLALAVIVVRQHQGGALLK